MAQAKQLTRSYWGTLLLLAAVFTALGGALVSGGLMLAASQSTIERVEGICPAGTTLVADSNEFSDSHHGQGMTVSYGCCKELGECTDEDFSVLQALLLIVLLPVSLVVITTLGLAALVQRHYGPRPVLWGVILICFGAIVVLVL